MKPQVLLVFGRGVVRAEDGTHALTPASAARVRAAIDYPGRPERIIFTGGWAEACEGAQEPPAGCREGDLMLRQAREAGLHRYADLRAENRSRSTLENLLHTLSDGLLDGFTFSAARPLGLVSHGWHLPRVRFLAGKVLGLPGSALLNVPAVGEAAPAMWRATHIAARLGFLGVRDGQRLLRRERVMVSLARRFSG